MPLPLSACPASRFLTTNSVDSLRFGAYPCRLSESLSSVAPPRRQSDSLCPGSSRRVSTTLPLSGVNEEARLADLTAAKPTCTAPKCECGPKRAVLAPRDPSDPATLPALARARRSAGTNVTRSRRKDSEPADNMETQTAERLGAGGLKTTRSRRKDSEPAGRFGAD